MKLEDVLNFKTGKVDFLSIHRESFDISSRSCDVCGDELAVFLDLDWRFDKHFEFRGIPTYVCNRCRNSKATIKK